jgi:hypothetical protein
MGELQALEKRVGVSGGAENWKENYRKMNEAILNMPRSTQMKVEEFTEADLLALVGPATKDLIKRPQLPGR